MKKGFTLIELLAVVVVLALILAIAVPNITNLINNSRLETFNNQQTLLKKAAMTYLAANSDLNPTTVGSSTFIKLSDLISNNYITNIVDPKDKSNCDTTYSGVKVTLNSYNSYNYDTFLNCTNYKGDDMAPIISTNIVGNSLNIRSNDENLLNYNGVIGAYSLINYSFPSVLIIEAWGNSRSFSSNPMLWSFSYAAGPDLFFACGSRILLNIGDGCSNPFTNSINPSINEWHHYAVTFDQTGNTGSLYVDGVFVGTAVYKNPSSNYLYIGTYNNKSYPWSGYIKDVRVWSTLRSVSDISNNMYNTLNGNENGLLLYYRMNEGEGTTLIDSVLIRLMVV